MTEPLSVVIVGSSSASTSSMFVLLDVMNSVGQVWQYLTGTEPPAPRFRASILSPDGAGYRDYNGSALQPHGRLDSVQRPYIILIPDQYARPTDPPPNDYAVLADWLRNAHAKGALVGSVCSGSMLLAYAGMLDGLEAATHWAFCDALAARYPKVKVRKERILVPAGEGHRIITSGGVSSWHDLVLYLIARFAGLEEARRAAQLFLLNWHHEGQLPYACLSVSRQHEDKVIQAAQVWAGLNYPHPVPVREMAAQTGLGERSFLRRFRKATGQSPMEYIQHLRIEEAKQMLETTSSSPEDIAAEVGYTEPAAFRHIFKKSVGMTPVAYRKRYKTPVFGGGACDLSHS
jgi:transcriptional regulator GlxA family with amidase domain